MTSLLLRTLRGERRSAGLAPPPVWMMRQAGRYLPEYRALREKHSFLEMVKNPAAAIEATLQPVRRFGVDGAIIFSDIMVPLIGAGIAIEFDPGPKLAEPLRRASDLSRLRPLKPRRDVGYLLEALAGVRSALDPEKTALLGFAGAPLTLAAYLIEGGGSRDFERARATLLGDEAFAAELLSRLADMTIEYLSAQIDAGAQAVQLFDSWAGILDLGGYERLAVPPLVKILAGLRGKAPVIYFAQDGAHLYPAMLGLEADALSVDWRWPLPRVAEATGHRYVLQGNFDPALLLSSPELIRRETLALRRQAAAIPGLPGHVLNLGHGISRHTPVEHAAAFISAAREPLV